MNNSEILYFRITSSIFKSCPFSIALRIMMKESTPEGCSLCSICRKKNEDNEVKLKITKKGPLVCNLEAPIVLLEISIIGIVPQIWLRPACLSLEWKIPMEVDRRSINLRSTSSSFDFDSFLCGEMVLLSSTADKSYSVSNYGIRKSWKSFAFKRSHEWGNTVTGHIESVLDLKCARA